MEEKTANPATKPKIESISAIVKAGPIIGLSIGMQLAYVVMIPRPIPIEKKACPQASVHISVVAS